MENNSCLLRIQQTMHTFSPKEYRLAQYIVDHPLSILNLSVDELAAESGVSISTVMRLCKGLNYSGYKELCRNLHSDLILASQEGAVDDIHPGDSVATVMKNVQLNSMKELENTVAINSTQAIERAVEMLCTANRIDFFGLGASGVVAIDAASKFMRCGKMALAHTEYHEQMIAAMTLKEADVAVLISFTGETGEILNAARTCQAQGAQLITITRYGHTKLGDFEGVHLYSSSTETPLRSAAMSSRISQLFMVDMLFTAACSLHYDEMKPFLDRSRALTTRTLHPAKPAD